MPVGQRAVVVKKLNTFFNVRKHSYPIRSTRQRKGASLNSWVVPSTMPLNPDLREWKCQRKRPCLPTRTSYQRLAASFPDEQRTPSCSSQHLSSLSKQVHHSQSGALVLKRASGRNDLQLLRLNHRSTFASDASLYEGWDGLNRLRDKP